MTIVARLALAATLTTLSLASQAATTISPQELKQRMNAGNPPLIIDVRSEQEFLAGRIPGARLIDLQSLPNYASSLAAAKDDSVLVYCSNQACTQQAAGILENAGFTKVLLLKDNYEGWSKAQ